MISQKKPYSKALDKRLIEFISQWDNVIPREMFGGVCYLLNGNMVCGVYKDFLILRLGIEGAAPARQHPQVRGFRYHRPSDEGVGHGRRAGLRREAARRVAEQGQGIRLAPAR